MKTGRGATGVEASAVAAASLWSPPARFDEYRLVRLIGQGAMGRVYLAHDLTLDRQVAIKFIGTGEPSETARRHFLHEARAIARLTHPNVVSIYRVGEIGGHPYLVSEFVPGKPLHHLDLPLDSDQVIRIGVSLARGLAAAHRRGVLHRDIKPANAILADEGEAKLLDFGVAKLVDAQWRTLEKTAPPTAAPSVEPAGAAQPSGDTTAIRVGTPLYLAPELWHGEKPTARSDLYSLGVLLYELCAGAAPFAGLATRELSVAATTGAMPPLGAQAPHIDRGLVELIERCLARDPAARPGSADELREALEQAASRRLKSRQEITRPSPAPRRPRSRRRPQWIALAVASLVAAALGARLMVQRRRADIVPLVAKPAVMATPSASGASVAIVTTSAAPATTAAAASNRAATPVATHALETRVHPPARAQRQRGALSNVEVVDAYEDVDALPVEARRWSDSGLAHARRGEYAQAIASFKAAYAIKPVPELLYDIAEAQRGHGDCEQALGSYQEYWGRAPDGRMFRKAEARMVELAGCKPVADDAEPASPASGAR